MHGNLDPIILLRIEGAAVSDFTYRDSANPATIGRKSAVGFRNRLAVFIDWIWSYVTYQQGARLFTGTAG
jgi:hypothetical protein